MNSEDYEGFKNLGVFCAALTMGVLGGTALLAVCCGMALQIAAWVKAAMT